MQGVSTDTNLVFSESNARYLLEVAPDNLKSVLESLDGLEYAVIGLTGGTEVSMLTRDGHDFIRADLGQLSDSHHTPVL